MPCYFSDNRCNKPRRNNPLAYALANKCTSSTEKWYMTEWWLTKILNEKKGIIYREFLLPNWSGGREEDLAYLPALAATPLPASRNAVGFHVHIRKKNKNSYLGYILVGGETLDTPFPPLNLYESRKKSWTFAGVFMNAATDLRKWPDLKANIAEQHTVSTSCSAFSRYNKQDKTKANAKYLNLIRISYKSFSVLLSFSRRLKPIWQLWQKSC